MKRILIAIAALIITSVSCGLPFTGKSKATESPAKTPVSPVIGATAMPSASKLGESYLSKEGGYSLKKVNGYSFDESFGAITMLAQGANPEAGPVLFAAGGLNKEIMTNDELMAKFKGSSTAVKITGESAVTIKNVKGLAAMFSGAILNQPIKGKIVLAMVTPFHQFMMMGNAPADLWDKEVAAIFDAVLSSVEFTTPAISSGSTQPAPTLARTPSPTRVTAQATRTSTPSPASSEIRQWARSATASSQYSSTSWSASQATGAPNTAQCSSAATAWAPQSTNTVEWIELSFEKAVFPTEITVIQSFNPSQVSKVEIIATTGEKYIIYEGTPEKVEFCPDEYTFSLELTKNISINKIRVTVDQRVLKIGRIEIDAVELVGMPEPTAQAQSTRTATNRPATAAPAQPTTPFKPGGPLPAAQPGKIHFQVAGTEEDGVILNATPWYKSTDKEYMVNLWSADKPSIMPTMILLKGAPIAPGEIKLKAYDQSAATAGPSFIMIVGIYFYYAKEGTLIIEAVDGDAITGKFSFTAGRRDNPSKVATVSGVFNKIPLK